MPNGRTFGDGTGEFLWAFSSPTRDDFFSVRIDQQLNDNNSLFGRVTFDDALVTEAASFPHYLTPVGSRFIYNTLELKTTISPTVFNVFRFAYNRTNSGRLPPVYPDIPASLSFIPGRLLGEITTGASGTTGQLSSIGVTNDGDYHTQNLFEYSDDLKFQIGRHFLHTGVDIQRIQLAQKQGSDR